MTLPVLIQPTDGQFCASLVGSPELRCIRPTRAEALAALRSELARKVAADELVDLEIEPQGVAAIAGRFQDDPDLREICADIYRQRDAQQDS
jgi:hypothetical protein